MDGQSLYEHIRHLSDSDQDSGQALQRFAQCLQQSFGSSPVAFISTRALDDDRFRLLAHSGSGDEAQFSITGLFEGDVEPPVQQDPLARRLRSCKELHFVSTSPLAVDGPLLQILGAPATILAIPLFL
ncbi:MAG: hypothetical protein ACE5ET_00955, partial [Gammaproteobacteria bacterium]